MLQSGISASMMCVDFCDTKKDIALLEKCKIDYLHFDIMDGEFVPNYTLGPCMINALRGNTVIPFDVHLMVVKPEDKIPFFDFRQGDAVSIHAESTLHLQRVLNSLKQKGIITGVALNPATPIDCLKYILDVIDFVLIMTVNPGFAGQKLVQSTLAKITETRQFLNANNRQDVAIQVDGNVSFENAILMKKAGADNFVAGTAGLFRQDMTMEEAANKLRDCIK